MTEYRAKSAYQQTGEADTYDAARFRSLKGRWEDRLEKRAMIMALRDVPSGARVLDLPCGTGRITEFLLDLGYKVVGADISEPMMAHAREKLGDHPNLETLQQADAESLPYADAEFDAVTSIRFSNHVPPDVRLRVLKEMRRVSKGPIIISYCNPNTISALKRRVKALIRKPHAPWNPATPRQVAAEAAQAGLKVSQAHAIIPLVSETVVYALVVQPFTDR
ncbi:MAG: class I SAM-dependent methyltransferase [Armatimonadota bacterium]|nr:class I SAM-dependent methyltransferase [Armatimonadota bacterium]